MDDTKLRALADLEAIRDLPRRYAHCVWQKNVDGAIDLHGDTAEGTVYLDLRSIDNGESLTGHGYYTDRYARVGDGWKFTYRQLALVDYREI